MKLTIITVILIISFSIAFSKTIRVGQSENYIDLNSAMRVVMPGDTIFLNSEEHRVDQYISNINGTPDKWIVITSNPRNPAVFEGGSTAIQFSDVSYLHISNLVFGGQTGNGFNIDDGGSYETPSQHIIFENCSWTGMNATGNNDELKMSGIDNFEVRFCNFDKGAEGGSLIDMVGCHNGKIYGNSFKNAGSNAIQAKGGCSDIDIYQNFFQNAGQRSINIGGSTGLQFFRPLDAKYEAKNIRVYSNQFRGSIAPIAFVGATKCSVINNLLYMPSRWLVRILQENTTAGFVQCSDNVFANNICYFNNSANNERGINIGANTLPNTFDFSNNLWFNVDNSNWNGPNPAVNHSNTILNQNPLLIEYDNTFKINPTSPAVGKGKKFDFVELDYFGSKFNNPPSIGACEGNPPTTGLNDLSHNRLPMNFDGFNDFCNFLNSLANKDLELHLFNLSGSLISKINLSIKNWNFDDFNLANGFYLYSLSNNKKLFQSGFVINY